LYVALTVPSNLGSGLLKVLRNHGFTISPLNTPLSYPKSTNPIVEAMKIHIRSFVPVNLASGLKDMLSTSPTPQCAAAMKRTRCDDHDGYLLTRNGRYYHFWTTDQHGALHDNSPPLFVIDVSGKVRMRGSRSASLGLYVNHRTSARLLA
jgi:hypothetical protein